MREGHHVGGQRRKRVSRACDHCRKKKDRCDGSRPTCSPCRNSGSVCSYDPTAKKRGLPEGYVRGLEKLWALSISNIDGLERKVLTLLGIYDETSLTNQKFQSLWVDENVSDKLHESWKSSNLYGELEKLLSTTDTGGNILAASAAKGDGGSYYGFTISRHMSPSSSPIRTAKRNRKLSAPGVYDNPLNPRFCHERQGRKPLHRHPLYQTDTFQLRLPPNTSELLDVYFSHTHIWFPIIAKHTVLRTSYLHHNKEARTSKEFAGSADHAALMAVLSYTSLTRQGPTSPGYQSPESINSIDEARKLYIAARSFIPTEKEAFEIGHVQALLLLTLVDIGLGDWAAAWLLVGEAVCSAIHLSFEKQSQQTQDQFHQGNSAFMGCFLLDTLISVRLGHCPHMQIEDLCKISPLDEDGLEEWSSWTGILSVHDQNISPGPIRSRSCFNSLVKLAGFVNRICRIDPFDSTALSLCQDLLKDLEIWETKQPLLCRLNEMDSNLPTTDNTPLLLPHQTYLSLTHAATISLLYLRFSPHIHTLSDPLKSTLLRVGPTMAYHGKHFAQLAIPPPFEVVLRTIVNGIHSTSLAAAHEKYSLHSSHVLEWIFQAVSNSAACPVLSILAQEMDRQRLPMELSYPPNPQLNQFCSMAGTVQVEQSMSTDDRSCLDTEFSRHQSQSLNSQSTPRSSLSSNPVSEYPRNTKEDFAPAFSPARMDNDAQNAGARLLPLDDSYINKPQDSVRYTLQSAQLPGTFAVSDKQIHDGAHHLPATPGNSPSNSVPHASNTAAHRATNNNGSGMHPFTNDLDAIFHNLAHINANQWAAMSREKSMDGLGLTGADAKAFYRNPDCFTSGQKPLNTPPPPPPPPPPITGIWQAPEFFPDTFKTDG